MYICICSFVTLHLKILMVCKVQVGIFDLTGSGIMCTCIYTYMCTCFLHCTVKHMLDCTMVVMYVHAAS